MEEEMSVTYFDFIPKPPDWKIDWDRINEFGRPWLRLMRATSQDPEWHEEGDVLTHTKMVCEELVGFPEWRRLSDSSREIVFVSALMHDIGKPDCTKYEGGRIVSPKHAFKGGQVARKILWQDFDMSGSEEEIKVRETIVAMIRYHSLPLHFLEKQDPLRDIVRTSCFLTNEHLALLSKADLLGRIAENRDQSVENVPLFQEFAEENDCWNRMFPFKSSHTRCAYFSGTLEHPAQTLYNDTWDEVVLLSGLPASGKDHFASKNMSDRPMISLDELRKSMKISWHDDQGPVVYAAKEKAKEYLRKQQPFVWNATNLTTQIREPLIRLFRSYKAKIKIVYLEASWKTLLERNRSRQSTVEESAMETMLDKLEFPTIAESQKLEIVAM